MNEQDSGVEVVCGCLTEEGNFILGAFFCTSKATRQVMSFLASKSHDLSGCARVRAREPLCLRSTQMCVIKIFVSIQVSDVSCKCKRSE